MIRSYSLLTVGIVSLFVGCAKTVDPVLLGNGLGESDAGQGTGGASGQQGSGGSVGPQGGSADLQGMGGSAGAQGTGGVAGRFGTGGSDGSMGTGGRGTAGSQTAGAAGVSPLDGGCSNGSCGDASGLPSCNKIVSKSVVGCVQWESEEWPKMLSAATLDVNFQGIITAVRQGPAAQGCLANRYGGIASHDASATVSLTVTEAAEGGSKEWTVEYEIPGSTGQWSVGQSISVDYSYEWGGWSPVVSHLTLRAQAAVQVHVAAAGRVGELAAGPVTVKQGAALCRQDDVCGSWEGYYLDVVATGSDAGLLLGIPVSWGESTNLGAYRITSGRVELAVPSGSPATCADWYVADASVAMTLVPGGGD